MFSGEKDMVCNLKMHEFCGFLQDLPFFVLIRYVSVI